jgi:two-component system, NtrC family, response regulator AlgB
MESAQPRILLIDDEPNILKMMDICLQAMHCEVRAFSKPHEGLAAVKNEPFDIAFVDLKMEPIDGMQVLDEIIEVAPNVTAVMMTAHGSVDTAVEAMQKGAYYYLQKPFDCRELQLFTEKTVEHHRLNAEVKSLRSQLAGKQSFGPVVTRNAGMREVLELATHVADSQISLLIEGESGTGKELVAQIIHENSPRAKKPFVKVNCAALPENLLESELFGHVKGAFTGAVKDRQGRFEIANGGTIFLDEIGEIPTTLQAKLLRVLQNKEFERLGESTPRKVDVRVVAATNKNLDEAMKEGVFREDLFYRLNGVRLRLPPLRERPDDIPLLVQHFIGKFSKDGPVEVSPEALQALRAYQWPGNVRELENVVERAVLLARGGRVLPTHLPSEVQSTTDNPPYALSLEEVEKRHIKHVLDHAKDYDEAAQILGIDPTTLWRKRKRYGF